MSNPAISSPLSEKLGTDGKWENAQTNKTDILDIQIQTKPGESETARSQVEAVGGTVEHSYGDIIFAKVRADRIEQLANGTAIRLIEERADPMAHSVSEGVSTTNADQLHSSGITGGTNKESESVTVVIIDQYFNPDQSEIQDQVIDQIGDSSNFISGYSGLHGTACAEIVTEMAPDANLVLASALGTNFVQLMDDITAAHDPEVMSMSLGYKYTLRLDGNDYLSNRIEDYTSASGGNTSEGGLFAVSAGNAADGGHYDMPYRDSGNTGYVDFDDQGTEFLEISTSSSGQEIIVQSDADWSSDQDYVLELYDDKNSSPTKSPAKTNTPAQAMSISSSGTYYLKIKDDGLSGSEHFDIFTWGNNISLPTSTSERSIGIPATSPDEDTLTTGAVKHDTDNLEAFSSRGPTQDGRRGVDIVAPDDTQSDTYSGEFPGTSAACPHVAGAAALLFDGTSADNASVRDSLYVTARDINDSNVPSPTNRLIGHGYVDAKAAYDALTQLSIETTGDTISPEGDADISVTAKAANQVTVDDLWLDWSVSWDANPDTVTDNSSSTGTVVLSWNSVTATDFTLTVTPPSDYIGGEYIISLAASDGESTTNTTESLTIQ